MGRCRMGATNLPPPPKRIGHARTATRTGGVCRAIWWGGGEGAQPSQNPVPLMRRGPIPWKSEGKGGAPRVVGGQRASAAWQWFGFGLSRFQCAAGCGVAGERGGEGSGGGGPLGQASFEQPSFSTPPPPPERRRGEGGGRLLPAVTCLPSPPEARGSESSDGMQR